MTATNPKPRPFTTFGERSVRRTLVLVTAMCGATLNRNSREGNALPRIALIPELYLPSAASTVVCFGAIVVSVTSLSVCLVHA